jgi:hypothetical protein
MQNLNDDKAKNASIQIERIISKNMEKIEKINQEIVTGKNEYNIAKQQIEKL